ncbi:MAG: hypothetical protein H0T51_15850 [Pirellulales bacterium]|nr:hypothetical protein [Pirellulales bacterium]
MPTWHFNGHLNPDHTLTVPPEVAAQMRTDEVVHIVLVAGEPDGDADWRRLAVEQFLKGYGPGDEIYDQVPVR